MKGKYNMNTKGKIDFTKTDNIQFIEEVASEISKEDKKIFSRLHSAPIRNQICEGAFEVRKQQTGSPIPFNGSYIQGRWNVGGKSMSRPTKTCYDCKNACWDSVPYGSTTATMFGGCDKEDEMTEEEAERFGETEDCPF